MNFYLCTNCGFWQQHFAIPTSCPVCSDFRHSPPLAGWEFLNEAEVARVATTKIRDDGDVAVFSSEPGFGIGPSGYLLRHEGGNVLFDLTPYYSPQALQFIADAGGAAWLSASHPHTYGMAWRLQNEFSPQVAIHIFDLKWTNAFNTTFPFNGRLELLPGLTLFHVGGHFEGQAILHWRDKGILFAGDMVKFHFEGDALSGISTHKAFNRKIPMSHGEIRRYRAIVEKLEFDIVYTSFDRAACDRELLLELFDAQLLNAPFFGPLPI